VTRGARLILIGDVGHCPLQLDLADAETKYPCFTTRHPLYQQVIRRTLHLIAHISGFHEQLELILLTQAENMRVVDLSKESSNALLRPIDFVETIFSILLPLWEPLIDSNDLLHYRRLIRSCRRLRSVSWEYRVP
jgi:hypothetical protein